MFRSCLVLITYLASSHLLASPQTWDFSGKDNADLTSFYDGQNLANFLQLSEGGMTVQIAGVSTTDGGDYEYGKLAFYGDTLGLINDNENGNTPDHSVDSYSGYFDAILLNFSEEVDLNGFGIGWAREDYRSGYNQGSYNADISIAANTSGNAFDLAGSDWKNVSNWSSINNYSNVNEYSYTSIDSSTVKSKQWLISVYNPAFGENWTYGNDGFKLKSFNTDNSQPRNTTSVPEPGTLAIFALGLLGLGRLRIRKR